MKRNLMRAGLLFPGLLAAAAFVSTAALAQVEPTAADNGTAVAPSPSVQGAIEKIPLGTWQSVESLNTARSRTAVVYFPKNGRFYVLGGEATGSNRDIPIEEYNPAKNTWKDRSLLDVGVSNIGAARVGKYIYVPGGWDGSSARDEMQRFNPNKNKVTTVAPLPAANFAHAVAAKGRKIYVMGGDPAGAAGTTNLIYDTKKNTWTVGAPVPTPTHYAAAVSDGKFIYLIGGTTANLDAVQRYDPKKNKWKALTPLGEGRGGPGAFFDGDTIWVVGGGWSTYSTTSESYNAGTKMWSAGPSTNVGARTFGTAFGGNMALKAGGWNGAYVDAAEILVFKTYRPDGQIKTTGSYVGNDIYNDTGKKQTRLALVAPGNSAAFRVRLQNDGNVPDRLRVRGPGTQPGFAVKYFEGNSGGLNITNKVKKGTYKTGSLQPGAAAVVRLEVTVSPGASSGAVRSWKVTARSNKEPAVLDTVKAEVKVQ